MIKKLTNIFIFSIFLIHASCGFKVVNNEQRVNFKIKEIITKGDKRINFKIKNDLVVEYSNNSTNNLVLTLNTKKTKQIKEKNIKNEITKYEVSILCSVELAFLEKNTKHKFTVSSNGDYLAANKYSTTIQNEKRLIDDLTNDLSDKIRNKINLINNDL